MAVEIQIFQFREFFRLGAHGELDWPKTLAVLSKLAKNLGPGKSGLALVDLRDAHSRMSDEEIRSIAMVLRKIGIDQEQRVAILVRPETRRTGMIEAARERGFDIQRFHSFERAVEWLSHSNEPDPDFDREIYKGPGDRAAFDRPPTESP